jgi:hypothetical protein
MYPQFCKKKAIEIVVKGLIMIKIQSLDGEESKQWSIKEFHAMNAEQMKQIEHME